MSLCPESGFYVIRNKIMTGSLIKAWVRDGPHLQDPEYQLAHDTVTKMWDSDIEQFVKAGRIQMS